MKKKFNPFFFGLLLAACISGCSKNEETPEPDKTYYMRATVDGTVRECNAWVRARLVGNGTDSVLFISGKWDNGDTPNTELEKIGRFDLSIVGYFGTPVVNAGTYPFNGYQKGELINTLGQVHVSSDTTHGGDE